LRPEAAAAGGEDIGHAVFVVLFGEFAAAAGAAGGKVEGLDAFAEGGPAKRILGWTGVGVGSAGLVLSGVTGIVALKKHATLESQCHPGCPVSATDDLSTFRTARTISYASFIVGAASLGVGGYLLLSGSNNTPSIGATIGPEQVALWGHF